MQLQGWVQGGWGVVQFYKTGNGTNAVYEGKLDQELGRHSCVTQLRTAVVYTHSCISDQAD